MGDAQPKTLFQSMGNYQDFRVWLTNHKLQALGTQKTHVFLVSKAVCTTARVLQLWTGYASIIYIYMKGYIQEEHG